MENILLLLSPMAPHLCEELWERLGHEGLIAEAPWPEPQEEALKAEEINIVVQVNGKVRDQLKVPVEAGEEEIKDLALKSEKVRRHLEGKEIKKVIFVPGRLINFVAR